MVKRGRRKYGTELIVRTGMREGEYWVMEEIVSLGYEGEKKIERGWKVRG